MHPCNYPKTVNVTEFDVINDPSKDLSSIDTLDFIDKTESSDETNTGIIIISKDEVENQSFKDPLSESASSRLDNLIPSDTFGGFSSSHDDNFCPTGWFPEDCCTCYWLR